MISAIKKGKNECFIGCLQFLYYKKWKQYLPDKIIKDFFHFSYKGISLKSIKNNINKINADAKIYYGYKKDVPQNKWVLVLIEKDNLYHFMAMKKKRNKYLFFDPELGHTQYDLPGEFIVVDIDFNNEFNWKNKFNFKNSKSFSLFSLTTIIISTFLTIILSYYFKYALISIQNKSFPELKSIIIFFALIGLINVFWSYLKNIFYNHILWRKIKSYYEYYFDYILNSNIKLKLHFSKMQIYNSLNHGVEYLKYNLLEKIQAWNSIILAITTAIIIAFEFSNIFIPIIILLSISSLLNVIFKKKIFNNQEKIRLSEIKVGNIFLKIINNLEISTGFEYLDYKKLVNLNIDQNTALNKKQSFFNQWVNLNYTFIAYLFNIIISGSIFVLIIKNNLNLANGIYLITISTLFYSSLLKFWVFWYNRDLEKDNYYKFCDVVSHYKNDTELISYDGKTTWTNKLFGIKGHFQLTGLNGVGKSTYLKLMCNLFKKADSNKIYLTKDTQVLNMAKLKTYKEIKLFKYYLKHNFLSSGQQQIKNILLALEKDFELLVIDEAMSSVDKKIRKKIYKYIFNTFPEKTILIVDHDFTVGVPKIDIML